MLINRTDVVDQLLIQVFLLERLTFLLTLLRSQKILLLLVFWGLFRPQKLTDLPTTYLTTYTQKKRVLKQRPWGAIVTNRGAVSAPFFSECMLDTY